MDTLADLEMQMRICLDVHVAKHIQLRDRLQTELQASHLSPCGLVTRAERARAHAAAAVLQFGCIKGVDGCRTGV